MGETTGISWTDSTINVWHGCEKVSAGCRNCYAEVSTPVRVKRARGLEVWGKDAARDETKGWEANLRKWQKTAAEINGLMGGTPKPWRVFGQSLSDTFEGRSDLDPLRARFFAAIEASPALTFQLLTKRPENVLRMVPASWLDRWPAHVWIGCTVEDQENADLRIPHLLKVPAAVRFLSVEPQVGPVILHGGSVPSPPGSVGEVIGRGGWLRPNGISWVIQGGESGSKARPFDLAWARSMRDQCLAAGVAFFMKQGHKGAPVETLPEDIRIQEFPDAVR